MADVKDVYVLLTANTDQFKAKMAEADAKASESAGILSGVGKAGLLLGTAVAAGAAVGAVASVDMAAKFQASMTLIHTQAGATGEDLHALGQQVMALATQTATGPDELAAGLYHLESAGYRGAAAIDALRAATELAKIGNANLEDTTQAVIGVLSAYPQYAGNASAAAATLNAIVGTGDMRMQGLAAAMSTGILPAAQNVKLSLTDVGAALATLTDNVTPPDEAATRLRMTFSLLEHQSSTAATALASIGIKSGQLGQDLVKPNGLLVAVQDLHDHLAKAFGAGAVDDLNHYVSIMNSQGVDAANKYAAASSGAARVVLEAFGVAAPRRPSRPCSASSTASRASTPPSRRGPTTSRPRGSRPRRTWPSSGSSCRLMPASLESTLATPSCPRPTPSWWPSIKRSSPPSRALATG